MVWVEMEGLSLVKYQSELHCAKFPKFSFKTGGFIYDKIKLVMTCWHLINVFIFVDIPTSTLHSEQFTPNEI